MTATPDGQTRTNGNGHPRLDTAPLPPPPEPPDVLVVPVAPPDELPALRDRAARLLLKLAACGEPWVAEVRLGAVVARLEVVVAAARPSAFSLAPVRFSDDYRTAYWFGETIPITETQAKVMRVLCEAYQKGKPDVGHDALIAACGTESVKLSDVFKGSLAWGRLITWPQRGVYRINDQRPAPEPAQAQGGGVAAGPAASAPRPPQAQIRFGDGFRTAYWFGLTIPITETQAGAVRALWEAYQRGTPDVCHDALLAACGTESVRISDVFKGSLAWGRLIVSTQRGVYRINDRPPDTAPATY
jgi:hypothetical protein